MRHRLSINISTFFALAFVLCSPLNAFAQKKPLVVATASIFADMAKNIAGEEVEIRTIVPIGGDPHIYEPTPKDVQLAASADLILKNGLTFEGWLNELIANSGTQARIVTITEGVIPIQSSKYKNATDPHAWMDARAGLIYIENIKNALLELVPEGKKTIEFNYGLYRRQLEEMDRYIAQAIQTLPENKRVLITSHDAFRYYGKRYGIRVEAVLGTSTDAEAQTSDIVRLHKVIKENRIPAIFIETTVNPKLIQQIASDNKIKIGGKLYSDSIGDENSSAPSYLDMLQYNTNTIVQALSQDLSTEDAPEAKGGIVRITLIVALGLLLGGGFFLMYKKING